MEVYPHAFLTSAPEGGESLVLGFGSFTTRQRVPFYRDRLDPTAGLDEMQKESKFVRN
jgi:hypothetical protein